MNLRTAALLTVLAVFAAGCTSTAPTATQPAQVVSSPSVPAPGGVGSGPLPASGGEITQASVSNGNGQGGGQVRDIAPTVPSFTSTTPSVENSGGLNLTFNGTLLDPNGEQDLQFIFVKGTTFNISSGVQTLGANHTITTAERALASEPAAFASDGYKVWDCGNRDGLLCWKYNLSVPLFAQSGIYTFNVTAGKNASFAQSLPSQVQAATVLSFSQIDFSPYPVNDTGATQTGSNWGSWTANPGDANITSANFLKLTNNGDVAAARVQVSFSGTSFVGATDGSYTIPFASNVQFQYCDALVGATPGSCTFGGWTPANSGAATVTFAGKGHVIFVQYRVVSLPAILMAQSYGATFTATEL